jgi:hypothetical protein
MQNKLLFIFSIVLLFILLIIANTKDEEITCKIEKIKYFENLCIIATSEHGEILIFTNKILNLKPGEEISIKVRQQGEDLIADEIVKKN